MSKAGSIMSSSSVSGSKGDDKLAGSRDVIDSSKHSRNMSPTPSHKEEEHSPALPPAEESDPDLEKAEKEVPAAPSPFDPSQYPDGGLQAWLVVVGGFACLFVSFGWINCIGIFQDYYEQTFLRSYSSSTVSWIPSLEAFMMFAGGPVIGKLYDNYGPRYILLTGSFLHVFGLMMTSLSTEYYQFILAQGICSPLGASMVFYPATSSATTWFWKYRALAFGFMAAGSSIGGVVIPIMVSKLIPQIGFPWTMRAAAFMLLGLLVVANLTVKSRLPPQPKPFHIKEFFTPFAEVPFALTTIGCLLFFFGMFLPINYIVVQGQQQGMSTEMAVYLISILNALSFFGRTIPGYVGDMVGRYNTMIAMSVFTGVIDLALWIPAKSAAAIIVFAALYGFGSGTFVSMAPSLIAQISDVKKIGVRTGAVFAFISVAALTGSPIGGAILADWNGNFLGMQIFTGVMQLAGAAFFIAARVSLKGWKLNVKV